MLERIGMGVFGVFCLVMVVNALRKRRIRVSTETLFDRRPVRQWTKTVDRYEEPGRYWYSVFGWAVGALVFIAASWSDFLWKK